MTVPKLQLLSSLLVLSSQLTSSHAAFGDEGRNLWIAHGSLMFLAWGVVFPLGALIAVYRKDVGSGRKYFKWAPHFYLPHVYFQMFGLVLNIISIICAARGSYLVYGTGNPFDDVLWLYETALYPWNHHVKYGVSVLVILAAQCILGYLHHLLKHYHEERAKQGDTTPWKRLVFPSWAHVILGPLGLILAYLTMIQGVQIYVTIFFKTSWAPNGAIKFFHAMIGISSISFVLAYLKGKLLSGSASPKKDADDTGHGNETV